MLIRKLAALLHLQMPQFGCRAMWNETGNGRRDVGTAAGASFVPWTVNAQMSKNRINPPASMIFDRTKLAAAGAWPRLCNYRSNLVVGDFGLRLADEVLAIVTGVRPRSASQVSSGRSMRPTNG